MVIATIQNADVSCPNWLYIWMPSIPAAKQAKYTEPVPCQALNTGTIRPIASDVTHAAFVFGSRQM
ncbi:hypothetical protein SALBM217S_04754 [Streptomyces griseoloalbus]